MQTREGTTGTQWLCTTTSIHEHDDDVHDGWEEEGQACENLHTKQQVGSMMTRRIMYLISGSIFTESNLEHHC